MLRRRLLYLICLIGCFGFYIAYREWFAWVLLLVVALLPWLSLLLSLPAMILLKAELVTPKKTLLEGEIPLRLQLRCPLPVPPTSWRYRIYEPYTNRARKLKQGNPLFAEHCGCVRIEVKRAWKYDYLGLFRWRLCRKLSNRVLIWPKTIPVDNLPSLKKYMAARWKPKAGGFAESYDLRIYRPGDSLRQIHWKLSAKTGKFIFREPMTPVRGVLALTMTLNEVGKLMDEKLGNLLYLSKYLLAKDLPHELHCLTQKGVEIYKIENLQQLDEAITALLCAPLSLEQAIPPVRAAWQYHIGGGKDEA